MTVLGLLCRATALRSVPWRLPAASGLALCLALAPVVVVPLPVALAPATPVVKAEEAVVEFAVPVPVLPAGTVNTFSTLYLLKQGVGGDYPWYRIISPTAAVLWVHAGTMALRGEPIAVHRASATAATATSAPARAAPCPS